MTPDPIFAHLLLLLLHLIQSWPSNFCGQRQFTLRSFCINHQPHSSHQLSYLFMLSVFSQPNSFILTAHFSASSQLTKFLFSLFLTSATTPILIRLQFWSQPRWLPKAQTTMILCRTHIILATSSKHAQYVWSQYLLDKTSYCNMHICLIASRTNPTSAYRISILSFSSSFLCSVV